MILPGWKAVFRRLGLLSPRKRGCSRVTRAQKVASLGRKSWRTTATQWHRWHYALRAGTVGTQSLRSASPAPSSVLAHRPHSLHFWWVTPEGAVNGEAEAKHLALRETSQLLHSSPQVREMKWSTEGDEQGEGGGGARIQMQTQNTPKHLVSHL